MEVGAKVVTHGAGGSLVDFIDIVKDPCALMSIRRKRTPSCSTRPRPSGGPCQRTGRGAQAAGIPHHVRLQALQGGVRHWGMQSKIERFIHDTGEGAHFPLSLYPPAAPHRPPLCLGLQVSVTPGPMCSIPPGFLDHKHLSSTCTEDRRCVSCPRHSGLAEFLTCSARPWSVTPPSAVHGASGTLGPDPRPCTTCCLRFGPVPGDSGLAILRSSHPCWPGLEQVPGEQRTSR